MAQGGSDQQVSDHSVLELGDFALQSGAVLPAARLAYRTYGTLNPEGTNAIVHPTAYSGVLADNASRIGPGKALDPERYFIVTVALFGNGQSSSPSNTPAPFDGPRFPDVTVADNVRAQHQLVTHLGVKRLALVTGFSMGGLQSFEWGCAYPGFVERIAPIAGAARCSRHNYVFLSSLRMALSVDPNWNGGDYTTRPEAGLRAFGRIYAGWGLSQAFYRQELDRTALGYPSLHAFLEERWDKGFLDHDPNDLLAMLWTWQHADISRNERFNGDFAAALAAITARATVMPSETDLYFPVADSEIEVAGMPNARLAVIPSVWGHAAGHDGTTPEDTAFMDAELTRLLDSAP